MNHSHRYRERIYPAYTALHTPEATSPEWQPTKKATKLLLSRFKPWLPERKDAACLDVACGTGTLLLALKEAGYTNLHGVDTSEQQVSVAAHILSAVVHDDAINYLGKHPKRFDLITAIDIIEHFDKNEVFDFVDALYQALQPGGRLIVQTPNAGSPFFGIVGHGDFTHEIAFTPESLQRIMAVAGFAGFEACECRPCFHGLKSGVRSFLWHILRLMLAIFNLVETGTTGSGIWTRVFVAKVVKPV